MNFGNTVLQSMITALTHFLGWGDIFSRVVAELERVDKTMPHATGKEKLARFEADCEEIFDHGVLPMAGFLFNTLVDLGLLYLRGTNPVAAGVASQIAPALESEVTRVANHANNEVDTVKT